ncbi:hypothetical protein ABEB36_007883 [Hypothenemus hampei]|uniref:Large ribosomal subunit protein P2 n=1 Tax=Hypothenemus hampei TaxID=57062 RepID=A0ABD1EVJ8_HYPHA
MLDPRFKNLLISDVQFLNYKKEIEAEVESLMESPNDEVQNVVEIDTEPCSSSNTPKKYLSKSKFWEYLDKKAAKGMVNNSGNKCSVTEEIQQYFNSYVIPREDDPLLWWINMRYVAAYLLAVLGGNTAPKSSDIQKILGSVGVEADADKLNKVVSELNGKSIDEVIAQGREKLSSLPAGGGAVVVSSGAGAGAPAAADDKKEAKEEKKEESESEDDDMGFSLFD